MTDTTKAADTAGATASKFDAHHRQQLSALVDGELGADQARFMLRRIEHDPELSGCQERWQLLGDVMRGNACVLAPLDFSERVRSAIAAEVLANGAATPAPVPKARSGWKRWGGGAAIVASVAMLAMFISRQQLPDTQAPETVIASTAQLPAAPVVPTAPVNSDAALRAAAAVPAVAAAVVRRQEQARRGSATRTQQATRGVAARQQESQRAVAVNAPTLALPVANTIRQDPFSHMPATRPARPWPRSSETPSAVSQGVFNASVPLHEPQAAFYPFEPRLPAQDAESTPLRGLLLRQ